MRIYKRSLYIIFLISCIFYLAKPACAEQNKWEKLVRESGNVLNEIQKMPDQRIPEKLLRKCDAIAVFPSTISGGFGIGAKYGQGIIMVRDNSFGGWSPPAVFTLAGGSIGWQIGGQATDIVLLIMNRRSVDGLLQGKFKLGADAAVSAGPVGREAEASADIHLKGGILSYSRSRGLYAGVKLEGAVIKEHKEGNWELYGKEMTAEEILMENLVEMPDSAKTVLRLLR